SASPNGYGQTNLVSDLPGIAKFVDPNLVNPWGIAFSPTSPLWIADNGTGLATLYNGAGVTIPLVVTIPPPTGQTFTAAPDGQVFNPNPANFGGSHFIFSAEDGTISAWSAGTSAVLKVDDSTTNAVFKGLALATNGSNSYLYATDFHNNAIDVFDKNFSPVTLTGSFTDPSLPAGYAPFGIQASGGKLYVTYAVQDALKHDDMACPGCGIVDVFNTDGTFVQRLISNGALNSPWGLAWAPGNFGKFSGDLLVGNFGDGTINAFDPVTGIQIGTIDGGTGMPLVNDGLWGLAFGNGAQGTTTNTLYFTAGLNGESDGLFGAIVTPEPGTLTLLGTGFMSLIGYGWRRGKRNS
ncbi:MAG TPA: TIGR03118 family protein, partial [Candidatus Angelobacter sp.]|nr:TIGR03118 family protein [Candidatus Angelobacter sp.]